MADYNYDDGVSKKVDLNYLRSLPHLTSKDFDWCPVNKAYIVVLCSGPKDIARVSKRINPETFNNRLYFVTECRDLLLINPFAAIVSKEVTPDAPIYEYALHRINSRLGTLNPLYPAHICVDN